MERLEKNSTPVPWVYPCLGFILADARFGSVAQELQPLAGLQEGLVRLG